MKKRTITKKSIVALIMLGSFMVVRASYAFVLPVIDGSQVGAFVSNIQNGISKVTNTKSQIENALETVNSVGDQATSMSKYLADLSGTVAKIGDIDLSTISIDKDIKKSLEIPKKASENTKTGNTEVAEATVENINTQINNGASSEEIDETINEAREEALIQLKELDAAYDETKRELDNIADEVIVQLNNVLDYLDSNTLIEPKECDLYKERTENLIKETENLKTTAQNVINQAKENLNSTDAESLIKNFDTYSQAIDAYQNGVISKEEFDRAGETFRDNLSSKEYGIDANSINQLVERAQNIIQSAKKLQEDILNSESNSRDYTDDDKVSFNIINSSVKYSFQFSSVKQNTFAKHVYFNEDLDEEYQVYAISRELLCHKLKEKDLEDLEKHTKELNECVTLAKADKGYICPLKGIDEDSPRCDPYVLEPEELYLPYKDKGVYAHIIEDYSVQNVISSARYQQFAQSWLGSDGDNQQESAYNKLKDLIEKNKISSERDSQSMGIAQIDIEGPQLWSKIRIVDTLQRAKKDVQHFEEEKKLYLDGRETNGDGLGQGFVQAYKNKPGLQKNIETLKGKEDGQLFSNVFLHHCGAKADDFSLEVTKKYDEEGIKKAEKNIANCMKTYVFPASGRPKSKDETYCGKGYTLPQCEEIWKKKESQAINDSAFQTLALSIINSYKSAQDFAEDIPSTDVNIRTLSEKSAEATTVRDDYAAGAQINYYETMQILGIVDADAQNLQTEILSSLKEITYNFFDESFDGE